MIFDPVEANANFHNIEDGLEHLVACAMPCTLESDVGVPWEIKMLSFESLDQVINDDDLSRFV